MNKIKVESVVSYRSMLLCCYFVMERYVLFLCSFCGKKVKKKKILIFLFVLFIEINVWVIFCWVVYEIGYMIYIIIKYEDVIWYWYGYVYC